MPMLVSSVEPERVHSPAVEVVFLLDDGVVSRPGRLLVRRDQTFEVELDAPPPSVAQHVRVVLSIQGDTPRRITGAVEAVSGQRLQIVGARSKAPDKRRFPRLLGAIGLRWRRLGDETENAWHEPDPLMSFSVVGLAFGAASDAAEDGDLLALDFNVGGAGPRYSAVARVVRVAAREADEVVGGETHEIAVELLQAPAGAREALAEHMLRIQRALTRGAR